MKNFRQRWTLFVLAAMLSAPLGLWASGTYSARIPTPPKEGKNAKVDRDKFDLGQKVFNGKTAPTQGNAATQRPRLEALQHQLPESVAKKKDLTALAGKLSEQQLLALEYFVNQRYPASK